MNVIVYAYWFFIFVGFTLMYASGHHSSCSARFGPACCTVSYHISSLHVQRHFRYYKL